MCINSVEVFSDTLCSCPHLGATPVTMYISNNDEQKHLSRVQMYLVSKFSEKGRPESDQVETTARGPMGQDHRD